MVNEVTSPHSVSVTLAKGPKQDKAEGFHGQDATGRMHPVTGAVAGYNFGS